MVSDETAQVTLKLTSIVFHIVFFGHQVAMELKLLRLEAKVAGRDTRRQQRRQQGIGIDAAVTDRPPPIATASSTPNHSDEEVDSFEDLELTPRGTNRNGNGIGSGVFSSSGISQRGGGGPANIAVVTRSGASVASAVTATSFQDFSHAVNDSERSDDGDIEDEGDNNDDGSASSEYLRISHR